MLAVAIGAAASSKVDFLKSVIPCVFLILNKRRIAKIRRIGFSKFLPVADRTAASAMEAHQWPVCNNQAATF
jgi:hypothetical protein